MENTNLGQLLAFLEHLRVNHPQMYNEHSNMLKGCAFELEENVSHDLGALRQRITKAQNRFLEVVRARLETGSETAMRIGLHAAIQERTYQEGFLSELRNIISRFSRY